MKKIIVAATAMFLLAGMTTYAGGGKKKAKKARSKKECCIPMPGCDRSKSNTVNLSGSQAEGKTADCNPVCCEDKSACKKG
ncbi:MAG: hypothetical protein JNK14_03150 [Chitinophagaceae bacterium]|nr:hypothetical protein [Chitinophagaceae bacterium]